jgi:hypothetical protein
MFRKGSFILFVTLLISCDAYKSMFLFSRFTIQPNTNVRAFKIIDTTSVYKAIETIHLLDNSKQNHNADKYHNYLRFKKNGELVRVLANNLMNWKHRESKLKRMQRYNYSEKGFYIEYHFHTVQGGWSICKANLIKHTKDSLIFKHHNYITKYLKTALPKHTKLKKTN